MVVDISMEGMWMSHLRLFSTLELGVRFTNEVQIFLVELRLLVALRSPTLPTPSALSLIGVVGFLVLIINETFLDLRFVLKRQLGARRGRAAGLAL